MKRIKLIIFALVLMLIPGIVSAHTITFNSNGGSAVAPIVVADQGVPAEPEIPTKEGYYFLYWCDDEGLTNYYHFQQPLSGDKILYAKWVENSKVTTRIDFTITMPKAGTEIKKVIQEDEYGQYDEPDVYPTIKTSLNIKNEFVGAYVSKPESYEFFYGTLEAGKKYPVLAWISIMEATDIIISRDVVVTVNGVEVDVYNVGNTWVEIQPELLVMAEYNVEGGNQTFTHGDKTTLIFKCEGALDKLQKILVNGKEVSKDNMDLVEGSTVLTLNNAYLNSLDAGEYTLTFVYSDGTGETTFKVVNNPKTGDNIMIYASLFGLSIMGLYILRKRFN